MKEYDVWECFVNGRVSYRAMLATGPVEDAPEPPGFMAHIERVEATNGRQAIHFAVRKFKARMKR